MSTARYEIGRITDTGCVRTENQDAESYFASADGTWQLLVTCDGMGGHAGGQHASRSAVQVIGTTFVSGVEALNPRQALDEALRAANSELWSDAQNTAELEGMGTTAVAVAWSATRHEAYVAHVGDSRVYRVRTRLIERLTRDHSAVQRMIDGGLLTEEAAKDHPENNVLSRTIGVRPSVEPEVQGPFAIERGDRFLLCSDGLHGLVEENVVGAFALAFTPQEAANKLVALAKDRGGHDNITVQILWRSDGAAPTGKFDSANIRVVTGKPDAPRTARAGATLLTEVPWRAESSTLESAELVDPDGVVGGRGQLWVTAAIGVGLGLALGAVLALYIWVSGQAGAGQNGSAADAVSAADVAGDARDSERTELQSDPAARGAAAPTPANATESAPVVSEEVKDPPSETPVEAPPANEGGRASGGEPKSKENGEDEANGSRRSSSRIAEKKDTGPAEQAATLKGDGQKTTAADANHSPDADAGSHAGVTDAIDEKDSATTPVAGDEATTQSEKSITETATSPTDANHSPDADAGSHAGVTDAIDEKDSATTPVAGGEVTTQSEKSITETATSPNRSETEDDHSHSDPELDPTGEDDGENKPRKKREIELW